MAGYKLRADADQGTGHVRIVEVATRADLRRFVRVPRHLYTGMPGYEPPLDLERMQLIDPRRSPFFTHGEGAFWMAIADDGRPLGRISAHYDTLTPTERRHIGHFGCFDAVDDAGVVKALIEKARAWHAERGRHVLEGPYTFTINEEAGVQTEGQERGAMLLMPWHPPYLAAHLEAAGLVASKELLAYSISPEEGARWRGLTRANKREATGYTQRGLDLWHLDREAEIMTGLFNASWKDNWGFIPMVPRELALLLKAARPILRSTHGAIFEIDGEPAAFAFALPNATELYRGLGGRLLPFNWLRIAWRAFTHRYSTFRFMMLGVRADLRDTAIGARLPIAGIGKLAGENPVSGDLEMSWILEDNMRMRRIIERIGGTISKRWRIYADPPAPGVTP
jgi:hypothetical protein